MAKYAVLVALFFTAEFVSAAAEMSGIWVGVAPGRNGEKQDVAFQFKKVNGAVSGVMFGDEFDLPVENLKMEGDKISFSVTTTNFYSGSRFTTTYIGTVSGRECQLTAERKDPPASPPVDDRPDRKKPIITLTRLT